MTEAQWRQQVIDLATVYQWEVYYVEQSSRWITRRSGERIRARNINLRGAGFPDLHLVRDRILYRELKRDLGPRGGGDGVSLSPEQVRWSESIIRAGGDFAIWRPSDYNLVERTLR